MRDRRRDRVSETDYTLGDYWTALYRRKWVILVVSVVAALSAGAISRVLPKQYEAQAVFYVPRDVEGSVGIGSQLLGARLPTGMLDHARAYASILQSSDARNAVKEKFPQKSGGRFSRDLDIVATREGVIRVFCRDSDPVLAADIANAMVAYFNEFHDDMIKEGLQASLASIDEQIERANQQIMDATLAKQAFQEKHGIGSMPSNLVQVETERINFTSKLLSARVRLGSIKNEMRTLDRQIEKEGERYVSGQLLETKEGEFHAELRERRALLEVELGSVEAEIDGLQQAIATIETAIRTLPLRTSELEQIDDDIRGYRQVRERYETTRNELKSSSLELRRAALVISKATPPRRPSFPRTGLNVMVAALAGLLVGVIFALLIDGHFRRRKREHLRNLETELWEAGQAQDRPRTTG